MHKLHELSQLRKLQWFVQVTNLIDGSSFGELALIHNQPRKATIKCIKDCIFGIFSQDQYLKIFEDIEKQEQIKKIRFLESLPFL
jgi:CRP-like cAMP-binding protein